MRGDGDGQRQGPRQPERRQHHSSITNEKELQMSTETPNDETETPDAETETEPV